MAQTNVNRSFLDYKTSDVHANKLVQVTPSAVHSALFLTTFVRKSSSRSREPFNDVMKVSKSPNKCKLL